ncbi:MAG: T9SS type A sorting domain-containing protein [Rhodothermales bacterium]
MKHRYVFVPLLFALLLPVAQAQTTFQVAVVSNTNHPNPSARFEVYALDGVQGQELTLTRGQTYVFQMNSVSAIHPFYLSTSASGGGAGEFTDGVTNSGATGNEQLVFTVPMTAPGLLYYQCAIHQQMGWRMNIVNATANEEDTQPAALALDAAFPNPFADATTLTLTLASPQDVAIEVFSTNGRRVATLHRGILPSGRAHPFTLDAAGLADGTYVVRATAGERTVERRVTLVR